MGLLFVLFQAFLYGAFLTLDLTGGSIDLSKIIKFSIIILCFCYALFNNMSAGRSIICFPGSQNKGLHSFTKRKSQTKSDHISQCLQAALFFTVISDLFILMLDYYLYGVLTFILVQLLYEMKLIMVQRAKVKGRIDLGVLRVLSIRIALQVSIAGIVCIILQQMGLVLENLLIATVFYFICILTNTIIAIRVAIINPKAKENVIFAIGMFLFLLCDINVGLFNLSGFISMPENLYAQIYTLSSILMWTFYAPAQVLIALSVRRSW
jgi:hypothetical protein